MSAELFNADQTPFNLAGETLSNELTDEGARRAQADAEANARKAQATLEFDGKHAICRFMEPEDYN